MKELKAAGKILEAARLESRTHYDLEMLQETGFCSGVENYARHLSQRPPGSAPMDPARLLPRRLPDVRGRVPHDPASGAGMYRGDISRKTTLVDFGFRLPSALDNRPLNFDEYEEHINQVVYVSATPGPYELQNSRLVIEQVIRPTDFWTPRWRSNPPRAR